jgi:hypothetical protein
MHHRVLMVLTLGMIVLLLIAISGAPVSSAVQTTEDNLLQGRARLDSYKIYFTEANGEASRFDRSDSGLSRLAGLFQRLGAELYTLEWRYPLPTDASLIIVAGPVGDLSADQTARLWSYLNNNGRLLILTDPIMEKTRALPAGDGLFQLLWSDMGLQALDDMVVLEGDMQTIEAPADEVDEGTPTPTPAFVQAPMLIQDFVTTNFSTASPMTTDLDGGLAFFGARSLAVDSSLQVSEASALVFSDSGYYGETDLRGYLDTGISQYAEDEDTLRGALPLIGVATNPTTGARVILIGDRDFATNSGGLQTSPPNSASFLYPANVQFLLNAVAWLMDAEPAQDLSFGTPGPTSTPTITPSPVPTETPESGSSS